MSDDWQPSPLRLGLFCVALALAACEPWDGWPRWVCVGLFVVAAVGLMPPRKRKE